MNRIIRVWAYSSFTAKPLEGATDRREIREVIGEFRYYLTDGIMARAATRKEADAWVRETGQKVETKYGYPKYMTFLGYRV